MISDDLKQDLARNWRDLRAATHSRSNDMRDRLAQAAATQPIKLLAAVQGITQSVIVLVCAVIVAAGGSINAPLLAAVEGLQAAVFVLGSLLMVQPRATEAALDTFESLTGPPAVATD